MGFLSMSQFREYCNGLTDTKDFPDKQKTRSAYFKHFWLIKSRG